jgi:7-cyano-7-deazaguanine reductase
MADITTLGDIKDLKSLGDKGSYEIYEPSITLLETFKAPPGECIVEFNQEHNEFTSLCPKTGQPDFATFRILYSPDEKCIESKSLKIYLQSYRNSKGFGESITNRVADDLAQVLSPKFICVLGIFSARGGIEWSTKAIRHSIKFDSFYKDLIVNFK